jgi:general secretion pathway protein M
MHYRARWQQFAGRARGAWQGLAIREQRLLLGSALAGGAWLMWLLLIQPPLQQIDFWQAETPRLRSQTAALEALLRDVAAPSDRQDLPLGLRQSLDAAGLSGRYQLQAPGAQSSIWQVTFDQAPAEAVIGWLLGYPRQVSLQVIEARLQRSGATPVEHTAGATGTLSGSVRMDQAQSAKEAS